MNFGEFLNQRRFRPIPKQYCSEISSGNTMLEDFFTLAEMKDGISTTARIAELVSEIRKLKNAADFNTADLIRQCSTAANTLASTKNEECLQHFVQLNGIGFLNQWLRDGQNCSTDISNSAEDLIDAILTALECLPVDNEHSTSCGIMPTVQHLLAHGSTKINQKARVLCQKWSSAPKCGRNGQHMDAKEACQTDHLKPSEASHETENNKQHVATEAAIAEAKSDREVLTCSGVPLPDPSLTTDTTDITKQTPVFASPNSSDGNAVLRQVNPSASSLASHGGLANVSVSGETSASNDVALVTNCMLQSDSLNAKSDVEHANPVDSTMDAKSLENINPENSFDSRKIDLGDQNVSSSLDMKKGDSVAADSSHSKNVTKALNHLANVSTSLQDSSEESMCKEEGPTSSSGTDGKGSGSKFTLRRRVKSFGDSSKAAETKSAALKGEKSAPLTEYGDTDTLEVARLVASEVEREVVDYRRPFCGSPDISSRKVERSVVEARQQPEPPIDESNDNKSSSTRVDSGSSLSLKEDGSSITDDSGPFSRKHARGVELGVLDLNANQYTEETDCHPKSNAINPVNLLTPIAVAASRGSSVFPARLHFEGELGWKGSAATSAFRRASPRRTPEGEKSMPASSQIRITSKVLFDLNVAESENGTAGEPLSTGILAFSSEIAPKDTSAAVVVSAGLELDLNCPCEEEAATTTYNAPSFWSRQQCHGSWSQPSFCSSSRQPAARNFDLNDNISILDGSSRGMDDSSAKTPMKDTADHSEVTILGKIINLGQKEYCNPNQHNFLGPSVESRAPVRSMRSYAHMPPDYSIVGYPPQSAAMSFPSPLYAPGGAPYMVEAKGAQVIPPLSGLGVGISHPSFASRTIQRTPSGFSYFSPSMDVNYGLPSEGARREAGSYWPVPFQGHTISVDERMSQGGSSGVVLKRKEPDSGWDIYRRH